jgi:hypothetical protein
MGQERTLAAIDFMSAFGGKADVKREKADIGKFMSAFDPIMSALPPTTDIPDCSVDVRY